MAWRRCPSRCSRSPHGALPVLGARFVDRIGKGIRGAPRDAMIADETPPELRGRAFGLRQSLDTVGAFLAPLAAVGLMFWFADDIRAVFWVAVDPRRPVLPVRLDRCCARAGAHVARPAKMALGRVPRRSTSRSSG